MEANPYPWLIPNADWKAIVFNVLATDVSRRVWLPRPETYWRLRSVQEVHHTASSSGTLQVQHVATTVAPGSGTNQLTGTVNLAATANIVQSGVMIAEPTIIGPGQALGITLAGTLTNLAGCIVTLWVERLRRGSEVDF